jgi:hypothetical protein
MNKLISTYFLAFVLLFSASAQYSDGKGEGAKKQLLAGKGRLTGKVVDSDSGNPMEYANIVAFKQADNTMVTGTVSNVQGVFLLDLPYGRYKVKVKFIGYNIKEIDEVIVNPRSEITDLGIITLEPDANNLKEIDIQADQTPVLYHLDRKIVKVSSNLSATGGSAIDALENTPSINVDIEGNVTMRGSSSFQVLVDGKPSAFSGSDALEMIPVSTIDQIEVITNPSAKYDPEGTAGIINVITKKNALEGISAKVSVSGDTNGSVGGDLIVNYKTNKANYFISANRNDRSRNGYRESDSYIIENDTNYHKSSMGDRNGGHIRSGIKIGADYSIGSKGTLTAGVNYGKMEFRRDSESDYREWTDPETIVFNSLSNNFSNYAKESYGVNLDYAHKFNSFGHELKLSGNYKSGVSDDESGMEQFDIDDPEAVIYGSKSTENGTDSEYRFKADYTLPFGEEGKFEAGYQLRLEEESEKYDLEYVGLINEPVGSEMGSTLNSEYNRHISAAYGIFANTVGKFAYQLGLRTEYTDRLLTNKNTGQDFKIDRFDYFPTLHFSVQLPAEMQLLASYARRIDRPRNYYLEPFLTWRDAYTVWQGNPGLSPEYINSYEASFQKRFGKSYISLELFHRQTVDKHERVRSVYDASSNIMIHTIANVGTDYSTGSEIMLNLNLKKWWNFNVSSSAYHYLIDSELFNTDNEDYTWYVRGRTSFILPKDFRLQLDANYTAPSVTSQGTMEESFSFGSSIRADFLDRRLSVNLQVQDMFGTGKHEFISRGDNFYSKMLFKRNAPVFRVSLSYKFNNYKDKKGSMNGMDMNGGGDMDF